MRKISARSLCAMGSFCLVLAGCNSGTDSPAPGTGASPQPTSGANAAPTITGAPSASVMADTPYSYQPSSQDPEGDALQYSISGKPAWATFSVSTGLLSGVPTAAQAGTYDNIVISVTDGAGVAALPAFSITVAESGVTQEATVLSWETAESQGAGAVSTVAGYRIYHGFAADALTEVRQVTAPDITRYEFEALSSGTHFFAVTTYTHDGLESPLSAIVSKTIS